MSVDEFVAAAYFRKQPEAAARLLEAMATEDAAAVLAVVPAADAAVVLGRMLPAAAAKQVAALPMPCILALFAVLASQAAATLLRHMDQEIRDGVLQRLHGARAATLQLLLAYPRTTIGAWMDPNALVLPHDLGLADARARIEAAEGNGARIYLLDQDRRVRGVVDAVALLRGGGSGRVESIASDVQSLWAREALAVAHGRDLWEQEIELPVVNRHNEFVGAISHRDIKRAYREVVAPESSWTGGGEVSEISGVFLSGLQGAWESLAEALEIEHTDAPGRQP